MSCPDVLKIADSVVDPSCEVVITGADVTAVVIGAGLVTGTVTCTVVCSAVV